VYQLSNEDLATLSGYDVGNLLLIGMVLPVIGIETPVGEAPALE
jgi:hypothetical protein